ncbi:hypothetical protein EVA_07540 [gut metagenome]|uniref:Uncharacterized protein n=1 Tax=gut metagenome TaxID=749906 RepID=J9GPL4_9ZZZZ
MTISRPREKLLELRLNSYGWRNLNSILRPRILNLRASKFQHMIGAVIRNETLTANIPIASARIGNVSITKTVVGEQNCPTEFQFEMKLPYHQV